MATSWSSLDRPPQGRLAFRCARGLLLAAVAARPAAAAEVYFQPLATLTAETNSNLELDPGTRQQVEGYLADVSTIIGIATPDSNTMIKPRLQYSEYPQDSADDRLEGQLDLSSSFRTQRSGGRISGSYQHLDSFNAELTSPVFNDLNPVQPTNPETGKVTYGASESNLLLYPTYSYKLTPIIGAGVSGVYQNVTYTPAESLGNSDFDYYQAKAFLSWSYSQRTDLSFGVFGSKFQVSHVDSEATGSGATVDLNTSWSPVFSTHASLIYQHTSIADEAVADDNRAVGAVGGNVFASYRSQVSEIKFSAGRGFTPSGAAAVYSVDTAQLQYNRTLNARLSFLGAVIGLRTRVLGAAATNNNDNRSYAQTLLEGKWLITRNWFVQGGYQYQWQKYQSDSESAANNRIYIRIGYQGLAPQ